MSPGSVDFSLMADISSEKTALILCGGGAKGAYEAGAIDALCESGIKFDIICGTSIGALNAAFLAEALLEGLGKDAGKKLVKIWGKDIDRGIRKYNWGIFVYSIFFIIREILPQFTPRIDTTSFLSNRKFREIIDRNIKRTRLIGDYKGAVDLVITGTDIQSATTHVFGPDVKVSDAVLASSAFPLAFPLVNLGGHQYADGFVFNNRPVESAIARGATDIYVVMLDPPDTIESEKIYDDPLTIAARLAHIYMHKMFMDDISLAMVMNEKIRKGEKVVSRAGEPLKHVNITTIQPKEKLPITTFGFNARKQKIVMELGREDTLKALRKMKR